LLPRLIPASSDWTYADPLLDVVLTFGENMNQVVKPDPAEFTLDVDGTDKVPILTTWDSATELSIHYSEAVLGAAVVRCHYQTKTDNFKSVLKEQVTPFDILVTAP